MADSPRVNFGTMPGDQPRLVAQVVRKATSNGSAAKKLLGAVAVAAFEELAAQLDQLISDEGRNA